MAVACQAAAGAGSAGGQSGSPGGDTGHDAAAGARLLLGDMPAGDIAGCGQLAEGKGHDQEGRKAALQLFACQDQDQAWRACRLCGSPGAGPDAGAGGLDSRAC